MTRGIGVRSRSSWRRFSVRADDHQCGGTPTAANSTHASSERTATLAKCRSGETRERFRARGSERLPAFESAAEGVDRDLHCEVEVIDSCRVVDVERIAMLGAERQRSTGLAGRMEFLGRRCSIDRTS